MMSHIAKSREQRLITKEHISTHTNLDNSSVYILQYFDKRNYCKSSITLF